MPGLPDFGQEGTTTDGAAASLPRAPSRRRATLWSLFFSYGSMVLVLIRNLALVPLYLHYIGLEEYGAWLATGGVLGYLMMLDLGLMGVITQASAAAYGAGDRFALGRLVTTGVAQSLLLACLAGAIASILSPFVPRWMGLTDLAAHRLQVCFLIVAVANGVNIVGVATEGILKSLQRPFLPGVLHLGSDLVNVAVTVILLLKGWGLYAVAAGLATRSVVAVLGGLVAFVWVCVGEMRLPLCFSWRDASSLWNRSLTLFMTRIGSSLEANSDPFLVGLILGPETAGMFALTIRAHDTVRMLTGPISTALMPSMAHLHGESNRARFRDIAVLAMKLQCVVGAVGMAAVVFLNTAFVRLYMGPHVYAGHAVNILAALWGLNLLVGSSPYNSLFAMGSFHVLLGASWLDAAIKIPITLAFLLAGQLWGAPAGSLIASLGANWLLFRAFRSQLQLPALEARALLRDLAKLLAVPLALAICLSPATGVISNWSVFITASLAFTGVAVVLIVLSDHELKSLLRKGLVHVR